MPSPVVEPIHRTYSATPGSAAHHDHCLVCGHEFRRKDPCTHVRVIEVPGAEGVACPHHPNSAIAFSLVAWVPKKVAEKKRSGRMTLGFEFDAAGHPTVRVLDWGDDPAKHAYALTVIEDAKAGKYDRTPEPRDVAAEA